MSGEWLSSALEALRDSPLQQGTLAALATFALEDPTTIGCGLLVANGTMTFATALIGVGFGIVIGDMGLYAIGRFLGPKAVERGWISPERLESAGAWMRGNLALAVCVSRCVPGSRIPAYVGAGVLRANAARFLLYTSIAVSIWTLAVLWLSVKVGEVARERLGEAKLPIAVGALALLAGWQYVAAKRRKARESADARAEMESPSDAEHAVSDAQTPIVSYFEFWPPWLFYAPVVAYCAWLSIRHRGATLPTCANPSIYSSGMIGESKSAILDLLPDSTRGWACAWTTLEKSPATTAADALAAMSAAGLALPVVAKPDQGQRGAGVQLIRDEEQLAAYLAAFPDGATIMLQELADLPEEAGVFYVRRPGAEAGEIFSITRKAFPSVVGDGVHSLRELILRDPRARLVKRVYFARHAEQLDRVLPEGERFRLVFAGNHCQGAVFTDGVDLATPALAARVDEIARSMPEFHFGRFDIRFRDAESFSRGEDFKIVEINGAGAEATHIWDARATLRGAYATLFEQFRLLYAIGAANRARGHRPLGLVRFLRDFLRYVRASRAYPSTS